ncbi:MAG: hypothetical protein ACC645_08070 [Pirellulales bacterium]
MTGIKRLKGTHGLSVMPGLIWSAGRHGIRSRADARRHGKRFNATVRLVALASHAEGHVSYIWASGRPPAITALATGRLIWEGAGLEAAVYSNVTPSTRRLVWRQCDD